MASTRCKHWHRQWQQARDGSPWGPRRAFLQDCAHWGGDLCFHLSARGHSHPTRERPRSSPNFPGNMQYRHFSSSFFFFKWTSPLRPWLCVFWITMLWQPSQIKAHVGKNKNAGHRNPLLLMWVEPLFSACWPRQLHSLSCCCYTALYAQSLRHGNAGEILDTHPRLTCCFFFRFTDLLVLVLRKCNLVKI